MEVQFSDQENNSLYQKETVLPVKKRRKIKILPDKSQFDHKLVRIACQTFTIRGMGKLNRGPQFLRTLWLFFIFIMTLGLIVATILIILEYLQYDVNINITVDEKGIDPFPSLTICHQHPFSQRAYNLWNSGKVRSPSNFSRLLYDRVDKYLDIPEISIAEKTYQSDVISVYYQNILQTESQSIGFTSDIFLNSMYESSNEISFEEKCSNLSEFHVRTLSHHTFFNCHTFEPKDNENSTGITQLGLIVGLGSEPDYEKNEQGFLLDLFNMAKGLRVIVHTAGTFPNIEEESVNVEPGKLNEINFQHVKWENLDTPTNNCVHDEDTRFEEDAENLKDLEKQDIRYAFRDLNQSYTYTEKKCHEYFHQMEIIDKCKCQYVYFPRIKNPDIVPYCAKIDIDVEKNSANMTNYLKAMECLQNYDFEKKFSKCRRLCNKSEYEWTTSITKWRAVDWQLHWLIHLNAAFKSMRNANTTKTPLKNTDGYSKWKQFYDNKDLTKKSNNSVKSLNLQGDNFAYVVLKRKQGGKVVKKEKLTLSIYVLFSRIGGLCSLTIGLTTAFFIEIIEFVYLIYYQKREPKQKSPTLGSTSERSIKKDGLIL